MPPFDQPTGTVNLFLFMFFIIVLFIYNTNNIHKLLKLQMLKLKVYDTLLNKGSIINILKDKVTIKNYTGRGQLRPLQLIVYIFIHIKYFPKMMV